MIFLYMEGRVVRAESVCSVCSFAATQKRQNDKFKRAVDICLLYASVRQMKNNAKTTKSIPHKDLVMPYNI